ncbi:MAG: tetratricopeptide repeat protein [Deltaproteobacteria bacterium]|nr:tetratricopeptide repeat protein [Deltaproteobacteria bacterium]
MAIDKEKTLQAAQRAVEKKKFDLAIEEYRKLASAEKNDPRWLLKIGDLHQKKGDPASAIATYEEVARFYGAQGFHLKAVAVYNTLRDLLARQPAALQSKYAHVPVRLAELYEKLQLTSDALATWDSIADRLQKEGRDREAVDVYRRIVALDASNPLAHLRLAEALSRLKDVEGAISEFAATAEQLTAQGRVDDAIKVYERLLHHRQDPRYARPAAELYLQRGAQNDGVAAIAKIQVCLKSDPKSVEVLALLARGFMAIQQPDKAVAVYKESARLANEQGKHDLRKDIVKRLQGIAPNDEQVRLLIAEVLHGKAPQQARAQQPSAQQQPAQQQPARAAAAQPAPPMQQQAVQQPALQTQATKAQPAQQQQQVRAQQQQAAQRVGPVEQLDEVELEDDEDDLEVEEREAAEELSDFGQQRAKGSRVAEVVANADAFRKVKLYAKALTTLRIGLELDPRSIAIRERIRDILIETGETDRAIGEMVTLAAVLLEDGDLQGSYDNLAWILEADPEHAQASQLMNQLQVLAGNAPAEEAAELEVVEQPEPVRDTHAQTRSRTSGPSFDELDEVGLDEPLPSYADDLDEPQAEPQLGATGESGLPAYDLDEVGAISAPVAKEVATSVEVESALEEADFYANQGVFETARETLEDALRGAPNHPLLLEKIREIDDLARAKAEPAPSSRLDDRAFDIAASLDALDEMEPVAPAKTAVADQVDVEEVFQKFKLGVAQQVEESDSATHYDLGVAYDQMMLYDDAISEFRIAARDATKAALCHSMIGVIYEKQGKIAEAIESYKAGLHSEHITPDEELALLYQLALAWEHRGNKKEAVYYLKRIIARDANYRDARQRLKNLEGAEKGSGTRRRDDIDEDFDAAFDDVMKPKGK